ncbi:MAG: class I SAM-dependent methyltransferase [Bauldia sp.]|uniref:class I SAM-dependent methyltransferase n=1 Tax=Bauldia sp. TaxID=2575872 RepID=UPI001E137249|nr:class I SAM-dependent methyltransferase [Bauldia sp.]MCB1498120.1 class I SAM-dependent methyltransferase [Bauldia sp.]
MTPLAEKLAARIRAAGPITVADYMAACLGDPEHGYYMRREPFGRDGDFITAPEVSQMFGELIGIWSLLAWEAMGRPAPFVLAELGPGRGTLMGDLLRAARLRPAFAAAARVHLVETSPRLRDIQAATLAAAGITPVWHGAIEDIPPGPMIAVANEFFDALPIRQFVRTAEGWAERMVALDDAGALAFGLRPAPPPPGRSTADPVGTIAETSPVSTAIMERLAGRLAVEGGAALVIDYGYGDKGSADTLQAVRRHNYDDPLAFPGEADLTAHVDFGTLADAARLAGAHPRPLLSQGAFLGRLGLPERASSLVRGKDDATREGLERAVARLSSPQGMGELFKVLAVSQGGLALAPFDGDDPQKT